MSEQELQKAGERVYHLMKCYNQRLGLTSKDDTIPAYFLEEPVSSGPAKGQMVRLEGMKKAYYKARGWDVEKGIPSRRKLEELDLKDVADDLEKHGMLPKTPTSEM
jgi:aldehyde:ferredoxin oxidoreductase